MESFLSISQAMWYTNLGPVPEIFVRSCKCHPIVMFREAFCVTITVSWSKGSTISYELELHAFRQKKSLKICLNPGLNFCRGSWSW